MEVFTLNYFWATFAENWATLLQHPVTLFVFQIMTKRSMLPDLCHGTDM